MQSDFYFEIAIAVFFTLLFFVDYLKEKLLTRRTQSFRLLLVCMMVSSYFYLMAQILYDSTPFTAVHYVFWGIELGFDILVFGCFAAYVTAMIQRLTLRRFLMPKICLTVLAGAVALTVATPWTDWFSYSVTAFGVTLYPVSLAVCVFLAVVAIYEIVAVWAWLSGISAGKKLLYCILALLMLFGTASAVFQTDFSGEFGAVCLFVVYGLYLTLQSPDFFIDHETRLYNRSGFTELLRERIAYRKETACLLIRVRNYHSLLQIYGDTPLFRVQNRLQSILKENCTNREKLFRIGSSTFVILMDHEDDPKEMYDKIHGVIPERWSIDGQEINHVYSYYEVAYPRDSENFEDLLQRIHYARSDHETKHKQNSLVRLAHEQVEQAEYRNRVATLIEQAIAQDNLEIRYQPIYSLEKKRITTLEVLSRLKDDAGQYIDPEFFIHVAEENRTIIRLGEQIFRKACAFARDNDLFGRYQMDDININLSPVQCRYEGLTESFVAIADSYGIPMRHLHLEITESEFTDEAAVQRTLTDLKATGAKIALDDFGTGYSTLVNILALPIDFVKIDKSLVWSFARGENQFLNDLLPMIKAEGKRIIAEGIETEEHIDIIERLHGDLLQGYYFSKPIPGDEFIQFLEEFPHRAEAAE